jgi:hypothetical protein
VTKNFLANASREFLQRIKESKRAQKAHAKKLQIAKLQHRKSRSKLQIQNTKVAIELLSTSKKSIQSVNDFKIGEYKFFWYIFKNMEARRVEIDDTITSHYLEWKTEQRQLLRTWHENNSKAL